MLSNKKSFAKNAKDKKRKLACLAKTCKKMQFTDPAEQGIGFYYSLLRFTYSQVLGEIVNVGILFIIPKERKLLFQYPKSFKRISLLYSNEFEKGIEKYCKEFETIKTAKNALFNNVELLISELYLQTDASSLQFDKPKAVLCEPTNEMIEQYFNEYFKFYE
jgi:cell division protein FtsB